MASVSGKRDFSLERASAFIAAAGLVIEEAGPDLVSGWIELGPEHHTPWGMVHGGVFATAVESAASIGATFAVADEGQIAVGVHNSTDFIRKMSTGIARVVATPIQKGRVQQLWQVIITDDEGAELARGQLRLQNVRMPFRN